METRKRLTEFLDPEEVKRLLEQPDRRTFKGKRDYAVLRLLLETGLRKSEVRSLRYSNIQNHNGGKTLVVKSLKKRKVRGKDGYKEKNLFREIPLNDSLVFAVDRYRDVEQLGPDDYIFRTIKTGQYQSRPLSRKAIDLLCREYLLKAGIKKRITPHSFRRTFATTVLRNGSDLATVKELLGHEHLTSTQVYLLTDFKQKRAAIETVNYGGAMGG